MRWIGRPWPRLRLAVCGVLAVVLIADAVLTVALGVTDTGNADDPDRYAVHTGIVTVGAIVFLVSVVALVVVVGGPRINRDLQEWRRVRAASRRS